MKPQTLLLHINNKPNEDLWDGGDMQTKPQRIISPGESLRRVSALSSMLFSLTVSSVLCPDFQATEEESFRPFDQLRGCSAHTYSWQLVLVLKSGSSLYTWLNMRSRHISVGTLFNSCLGFWIFSSIICRHSF